MSDIGIIVQGGLCNTLMRALQCLGLADIFGKTRIPIYVLNVTYPLVPSEVVDFCRGKRSVLVVEEGQPNFLEQAIRSVLQEHEVRLAVHGKDCAAAGRRIYRRADARRRLEVPGGGMARGAQHALDGHVGRDQGRKAGCGERTGQARSRAAAGVLRRLSGAARVQRHQDRREGDRQDAYDRRTSAVTSSRRCRPSISAIPCWATGWAWPAAAASPPISSAA